MYEERHSDNARWENAIAITLGGKKN